MSPKAKVISASFEKAEKVGFHGSAEIGIGLPFEGLDIDMMGMERR